MYLGCYATRYTSKDSCEQRAVRPHLPICPLIPLLLHGRSVRTSSVLIGRRALRHEAVAANQEPPRTVHAFRDPDS